MHSRNDFNVSGLNTTHWILWTLISIIVIFGGGVAVAGFASAGAGITYVAGASIALGIIALRAHEREQVAASEPTIRDVIRAEIHAARERSGL